jgi:choloylglycine hydrolase
MCTAVALHRERRWFCRTLDIEEPYGETVVLAPRKFGWHFLCEGERKQSLAMLGMAHLCKGRPLYYDAVSECGLAMAALRFPDHAAYRPKEAGKLGVASFELIPFLLGRCRSMEEARELLSRVTVTDDAVSRELLPTPLHWLLSDGRETVAIEPLEGGLSVIDAKYGVLTNAPPLGKQMENPALKVLEGEDASGLPGDFSSPSRFVRMAFVAKNAKELTTPDRCFSLLDTVTVPCGCAKGIGGRAISTRYSAVIDLSAGIYYFTTDAMRTRREAHLFARDLETAEPSEWRL